ncbi:MAG: VWA domain-containing protein [Acidobacteriota bacterium]
MKRLNFFLLAAVIVALATVSFNPVAAQQQKPPAEQDKNKKTPDEEDQEPAIKLGTALVTAPFNVTDKTNRYINDLKKDDIEIFEDNKPQRIFSFGWQVDLPITIAMLIDISGSQQFTLPYEVAAARRFLQRVLRPNKDLASIVTFEHESVLIQDFTSSIERLQRALDDVRVSAQAPSVGTVGGTPPINGGSRAGATAMYDSIYAASSELLAREAGRRVIILLTDGIDTDSRVKQRDAVERTWRKEVIVYAIGIGDRSYGGIDTGALKRVTAETGGRAFFPRNEEDLDRAFALIDEDLRSQYIITYESENDAKDGSFRTIQIRVKNRKDLTVRHRRGYFAPKES